MRDVFTSHVIRGDISRTNVVKGGIDLMASLVHWYKEMTATSSLGFFQIGGGIAGDFPICVVPLIAQDLKKSARSGDILRRSVIRQHRLGLTAAQCPTKRSPGANWI